MERKLRDVSGIIFDFDDTLFDNSGGDDPLGNLHQRSRLVALHEVAKRGGEYGVLGQVDARQNMDAFSRSSEHTVRGAYWVILQDHGLVSGPIDDRHPLLEELVALKNASYVDLMNSDGGFYDGAVEFVRDMARRDDIGDRMAICSTGFKEHIVAALGKYGLIDSIPESKVVDFHAVAKPKPHPEGFDKAFRLLGLPDSERKNTAVFEDDPRGLLAARNAELGKLIAITTRYPKSFFEDMKTSEGKPTAVVGSWWEARERFGLSGLPK